MKKIALGVDIGGINSAFGVVDSSGHIYAEGVIPTKSYPFYDQYNQYVEDLATAMRELLLSLDFEWELVGIGIGAPNSSFQSGSIEYPANLWKYRDPAQSSEGERIFPLTADLKRFFPECVDIVITNDANAATMGEMLFGAARGMKDFVVITLGTGLGSGFVAGGEMIYGAKGFAGELGHTNIILGGRECGCGNRGCLECYVSATGIKRTAVELMATMLAPSELREIPYTQLESLHVAKAAQRGDAIALEAFEQTGEKLGRAIANVISIMTPEAVIIFGGLAKAGELIFEPTRRYTEIYTMGNFRGQTKILPSGITDGNIAIIGASALIWSMKKQS